MEPDIEVNNHPSELMSGRDAQLDRAIEEVMKEIKDYKGPKLPELPDFPIRK